MKTVKEKSPVPEKAKDVTQETTKTADASVRRSPKRRKAPTAQVGKRGTRGAKKKTKSPKIQEKSTAHDLKRQKKQVK